MISYNIPKLQQGGSFFVTANYNTQQPARRQEQPSRQAAAQKEKKEDGIDYKSLIQSLNQMDGLSSDIQAISRDISVFLQNTAILGESSNPLLTLATQYVPLIAKMRIAKNNLKTFDNTYNLLKENEALGEIAVSGNRVLTVDENYNIHDISVSEFLSGKSKYRPLTNGNALWMRQNLTSYANDSRILKLVENGYGINKIAKMVQDKIKKLGTNEVKLSGMTIKQQDQIAQGLQILDENKSALMQAGMTLDGFYNVTSLDKNSQEQVKAALSWIYNTLPTEAQTILQVRGGNSKNPTEGAQLLLAQFIGSMYDSTFNLTVEYDKTFNKGLIEDINGTTAKADAKAQKDEMNKMKVNTAQWFAAGKGNPTMYETLVGNSDTLCFGTAMPITDKSDKPIGSRNTLQKIQQGVYGGALDFNKATIAGNPIASNLFNRTIITDSDFIKVDFPVDNNGNPDLRPTTIKAKQQFDQEINNLGINLNDEKSIQQNLSTINKLLQKYNLPSAYDSDGKMIGNKWKSFAIATAELMYPEVSDNEMDSTYKYFQDITDGLEIETYKQDIKAQSKLELDWDSNDWESIFGGGYSRLLRGTIFIPIKDNVFGTVAGMGVNAAQGQAYDEKLKLNEKRLKAQQYKNAQDISQ